MFRQNVKKGECLAKTRRFTSADRRSAVPLWRVSGDTIDGGTTPQLVACSAGERKNLTRLIKGLFRALDAGGSCTGVSARLVLLSWRSDGKKNKALTKSVFKRLTAWSNFGLSISGNVTKTSASNLRTHLGSLSLHLGTAESRLLQVRRLEPDRM